MYKNIISYFDEANQRLVVVAALVFEYESQAREDFKRVKSVEVESGSLRLHLVAPDNNDIEVINISIEIVEALTGIEVTLETLDFLASRQAKGDMVTLYKYEEMRHQEKA